MKEQRKRFRAGGCTAAALWLLAGSSLAWGQWGLGGLRGMGGLDDVDTGTPPSRLAFRPWISANGTYTQTLGQLRAEGLRRDFYGYGGAGGVSGAKGWERTSLAAFYTVNYQRWTGSRGFGGASQVAGVSVSHRATDKVGVYATQFAGSSLGGFGYGAPAGVFGGWGVTGAAMLPLAGIPGGPLTDLGENGLVDNELFGTRVNFYGTSGGVNYRPNLRWNFGGGAQAGFVRRKGPGLRDLNSAGVFGGGGYRLGQRTAIGGSYGYSQFSYPKLFGNNRAQFAGLRLTHQLTPQTSVAVGGGVYRMKTTFLGRVDIDPVVAELLGVGTQLEVQQRSFYGWSAMASLRRNWREWGVSVGYMHGLNPGNGLILASRRDSVFGSAGRGIGRFSFGLYGGYFRWSGLLQNTVLKSGSAGVSTGTRIVGDLYMGVNGGYSYFESTGPKRWQRFVSAHLTWSPSQAAFRF
jgi:hypothetical protein